MIRIIFFIFAWSSLLYGEWSTPLLITDAGITATPVVGIDRYGNILFIYNKREEGEGSWKISKQSIYFPLNQPRRISTFPKLNSNEDLTHSLFLNEDGNGVVSWFDNESLFCSEFRDGYWDKASFMVDIKDKVDSSLFTYVDEDQKKVIAYSNAIFTRMPDAVKWTKESPFFLPKSDTFFSGASSGKYTALWKKKEELKIASAFFKNGSWRIEDSVENAVSYSILNRTASKSSAVNNIGNRALAWSSDHGLVVAFFENENKVFEQTIFSKEDWSQNIIKSSLTLDNMNRITAVWTLFDQMSGNAKLFARTYSNGEWKGIIQLAEEQNSDIHDGFHADHKIDSSGNAYVVWNTTNSSSEIRSIYANVYEVATESWNEASSLLSNPEISAYNPSLAVNNEGKAVVVWNTLYNVEAVFNKGGLGVNTDSPEEVNIEKDVISSVDEKESVVDNPKIDQKGIDSYNGAACYLKKKKQHYTLHMKWKPKKKIKPSIASYIIYQNDEPIATIPAHKNCKYHISLLTKHHFHNGHLRKKYQKRLENRYSIVPVDYAGNVYKKKKIAIS